MSNDLDRFSSFFGYWEIFPTILAAIVAPNLIIFFKLKHLNAICHCAFATFNQSSEYHRAVSRLR